MPIMKMWDHVINLKEKLIPKKGKIYSLSEEKREDESVYSKADEIEIYLTIKVTTDCASILCRKEEWEEEDSIRLLVSQWVDSEEQLSIATYFRYYQEH